MKAGTIEKRLRNVLRREFVAMNADMVTPEENLIEALDIDSQSLLNLIMAVEKEWSIDINVDEVTMEDVGSIGGLVRLVERRLAG